MIRFPGIALSLLLMVFTAPSQDTVTVMHYNLLYYGTTTSFCTQSNNNINLKAANIAQIVHHVSPDLLTVNELGIGTTARQHFLDNVLNINGVNYYDGSSVASLSGGIIGNALFYNTRKFTLQSHQKLLTAVRDVDIFKMWYNDPALWQHNDTAFLYVVCTHLKSGNTSANAAERAATAALLMDSACLWSGFPALFSGDLNLYKSSENAWQILASPIDTTGEVFYDPMEMHGDWHDNPVFAHIHTQSTHEASNGCAVAGGLDDRFDFILMNKMLKKHSFHFGYIPGSYFSPGNDGTHFNQSINAGNNSSAPASIVQALFEASDHLPVVMKLELPNATIGISEVSQGNRLTGIVFYHGRFECRFPHPAPPGHILLYDLSGRCLGSFTAVAASSDAHWIAQFNQYLPNGFYIVKAISRNGSVFNGKLVIRN